MSAPLQGCTPSAPIAFPVVATGRPITQEDIDQALLKAVVAGDLPSMQQALDHGAGEEAREDLFGATALMVAAGKGRVDMVKILLDCGANKDARDEGGWTALMHATLNGQMETISFLIGEGVSIDAQNDDGKTALIVAASNNFYEVVQRLCEAGANKELTARGGKTAAQHVLLREPFAAQIIKYLECEEAAI